MERERVQRYVASMEQVLRNTHLDLREAMTQFQGYSRRFTTERTIPPGIVTDIRKTYKGIHEQLTKMKGIHQLLESRYRQYYRRDSLRDKEIAEFGFLARRLYTRFESILQATEAKRGLENREEDSGVADVPIPSQWFRSRENEVVLLRNLQGLYELDYKTELGMTMVQRRRVTGTGRRSLSLFALSGEGGAMDGLQSRMRLREYDIKERCAKEELRGALTHLRGISLGEAEGVIKRFMDSRGVPRIKGLLFSIQSQEDLGKEILGSADTILKGMMGGEVKTIPI
jgi:hypothetical protein